MARNRIIGAATAREARKPSRVADAAAHAEYREMICAEIGKPDFRALDLDDGRPIGLFALLFRPLSLFLIAVIALTSVYTFKLWREGWFEQFRHDEAVVDAGPSTSWIAGHGQAPPVEGKLPETKPAAAIARTVARTGARPVAQPAPEDAEDTGTDESEEPADQ